MPDDWTRLAHAVRERRENMGINQTQAVSRSDGGISIATWRNIEKAFRPPFRRSSLVVVCRVLGWDPESIDVLLKGGEAIEAGSPVAKPASSFDDLASQLVDLRRQVARHEEILERIEAERRAAEAEARYRAKLNQLAERSETPRPAGEASPQRERRGA